MNPEPTLREESVLAAAVELKAEYPDKSLTERIKLAADLLLQSREIVQTAETAHRREQYERKKEFQERISEAVAAKLVTGDKNKDRAIRRFREFVELLMMPENDLEPDSNGYPWFFEYLESCEWPKGWCGYLKKLFPRFVSLQR
jgi:hypothetical protein